MSQTEQPQQQSIQDRIAALNLGQVGRSPVSVPSKTKPRPSPPKPPIDRSTSATLPSASSTSNGIGNEPGGPSNGILPPPDILRSNGTANSAKPSPPPRLPPRRESTLQQQPPTPALPPRRPSALSRKDSRDSVSSVVSSVSALSNGTSQSFTPRTPSIDNASRVRAPAYDPTALPPLPPSRRGREEKVSTNGLAPRAPLKTAKSTSNITTREIIPPPQTPELPQRRSLRGASPSVPSLPSRPPLPQRTPTSEVSSPPPYARRLPPRTIPPVKARVENGPTIPSRPANLLEKSNASTLDRTPPPVPMSSRPDLSKILATKPKPNQDTRPSDAPSSVGTAQQSCLLCRDFSGPDNVATQYPRQNVPSLDWLVDRLTDSFPSPTDKARAIFTWLHHNIDYNVDAFFNKCLQPSTPFSTLDTGLAVCEGYAALFTALAAKAGLEVFTVGGHGKGFGSQPLKPGEPIPPKDSNHAWNAVKIDNGEWKLIDACWGAGYVNGPGQPYQRKFNASEFTKSNEEFGLKHYPTDAGHFFRSDGRIPTWEEYILGPQQVGGPVEVFGDPDEGFGAATYLPKNLKISTSPSAHTGPTVRFQFSRVCEHWDYRRNGKGKPYQYILSTGIPESGPAREFFAFDNDGMFWWCDVPVAKLGVRGEKIMVAAVTTVNGQDARGLSKEEYLMAKGRKAMSWSYSAKWELI